MRAVHHFLAVLSLISLVTLSGCGSNPTQSTTNTTTQTDLNIVSLRSEAGDFIGQGSSYFYTQANARITVTAAGNHLSVAVAGDQIWIGQFELPVSYSTITNGTYDNVQRYPSFDPAVGGMEWSGEGRGSNTLNGRFSLENVAYTNGALTAFDLRFEQHSGGAGAPALYGLIHWKANDATAPPGPVTPVPADLWKPSASFIAPAGNYIYLESDPGDYIGQGLNYSYTDATAQLTFTPTGNRLSVSVNGPEWWFGEFQAMDSLTQLVPGYYGGLKRYPFHNPARGGLSWFGEGRGSNTLTGWLAVDSATYTNGVLTAIDLRFEQHDGGLTPALHGKIHWGL